MDQAILEEAAQLSDYRLRLFIKNNLKPTGGDGKANHRETWLTLARLSIQMRNIDLAQLCIEELQMVSPNLILDESQFTGHESYDVRWILIKMANHLQIPEHARELLKELQDIASRQSLGSPSQEKEVDLLLANCVNENKWTEALELAEKSNSDTNIKWINHKYAHYLEEERQFDKAIFYYEKSGANVNKITRIIAENTENHQQLEQYCLDNPTIVDKNRRKTLANWFSCFLRDHSRYSKSISHVVELMKKNEDFLQAMDLLCTRHEMRKAASLLAQDIQDDICAAFIDRTRSNSLDLSSNGINLMTTTILDRELIKRLAYHYELYAPQVSCRLYLSIGAVHPALICSLLGSPAHSEKIGSVQISLIHAYSQREIYQTLTNYLNHLIPRGSTRKAHQDEREKVLSRAYLRLGLLDETIKYCCRKDSNSLVNIFSGSEFDWQSAQVGPNSILSESTVSSLIDATDHDPSVTENVVRLLIRSLQSAILYRGTIHMNDERLIQFYTNTIHDLVKDCEFDIKEKLVDEICSLNGRKVEDDSDEYINQENEDTMVQIVDKFREDLIVELAKKCSIQGQYKQAAKLYSRLGDRLNAVKVLMRTNEIDIVVNYAMSARDKAVYRLTANYLKYLNADPKTIKMMQDKSL